MILITMKILVVFFVTTNLEQEPEDQFPITVLFKKWVPYDTLVFSSGTREWNLTRGGDVLASFHGQGRGVCIINNIDLENVERY